MLDVVRVKGLRLADTQWISRRCRSSRNGRADRCSAESWIWLEMTR